MKRIFVSILSVFCIFSLVSPGVFAKQNNKLILPFSQEILNEVLSNDEVIGTSISSLTSDESSTPQIVETTYGYAVQIQTVNENDEVALTTIVPYKVNENNELVNSFDYAASTVKKKGIITPFDDVTVPSNFVDLTVTVKTYYAAFLSGYTLMNYYRHAGIEAWWSTTKSDVKVTKLLVNYETAGQLHAYPDVLSKPHKDTKIQDYYYIKSSISKTNPAKDTVFIDGNNTMPYNRVVFMADYFDHGGLIYVNVDYTVNGTSKSKDDNYYVYKK